MNDSNPGTQQLLKSAVGTGRRGPRGVRQCGGTRHRLHRGRLPSSTLGQRLRTGDLTDVRGVPTSFDAANLARRSGIPLTTMDDAPRIHVAIDGADEVDPDLALIKGGGAAHTQEKIVDAHADLFIVIVDDKKLVQRLGSTFAVPVELLPMAVVPVTRAVECLGGRPQLRMGAKKIGPLITDQGTMLLDVTFDAIDGPSAPRTDLEQHSRRRRKRSVRGPRRPGAGGRAHRRQAVRSGAAAPRSMNGPAPFATPRLTRYNGCLFRRTAWQASRWVLCLGLWYRGMPDAATLFEYIDKAEAWGVDSVWLSDHMMGNREEVAIVPMMAAGRGPPPSASNSAPASLMLPLRHPIAVAREVATLAYLSNGRMIMAAGLGADKREAEAFKVPLKSRGGMTDEGIAVLRRLWQETDVTHHG